VVFSAHRACVDVLETREGWATITGDTPPARRTEIENDFQTGKFIGLACTIKAGGVAITLTRASQAIFVDLEWTPALNSQAEDRICRIGQSRGCVITRMVADHPLDQRLTDILSRKRQIVESSVVEAEHVADATSSAIDGATVVTEIETREARAAKEVKKNPRRGPKDEREEWAARAICQLAMLDPDAAQELNGVGFNRVDGDIGHDFANKLRAERGLTEKQWATAIKIAMHYPAQVGRPETEEA
jgi:hypothetical protein